MRCLHTGPKYAGYKFSFAADTLNPQFHSFKAGFQPQKSGEWEEVYIPFTDFSNDWSSYTGRCDTVDPTGKTHKCCNSTYPEACPTDKNKHDISQLGFWAEGVEGPFHLEIEWIGAANVSQVHEMSPAEHTGAQEPCCQGKCSVAGEEKYWSIASGILGKQHCGEACMKPSQYNLYHFFEKNLTKSDSYTPCSDFGFTVYDSTPTHGFGPVKMTLDLYNKPSDVADIAPMDDATLYKISGSECGQATLDAKYASYAEKFAGLSEGTCASQGYTVADGSTPLKVPVLGQITISKFKKPSISADAASISCPGWSSVSTAS